MSTRQAVRPKRPSARVNVGNLRREIRSRLEGQIDSAYAAKISELVPTKMQILGVRVPNIRADVRRFVAEHSEMDAGVACDLFDACCERPCREELLFAQGILERFRRRLDSSVWSRMDRWIDAIDNWEVCDQLSKNVAAELIVREPKLSRDLRKWVRSKNPWRRRFALAASTSLNQGGRENVQLALDLCNPLMREADPIVQKAVGWALREARKRDAKLVKQFLTKHADQALPRILKEAQS